MLMEEKDFPEREVLRHSIKNFMFIVFGTVNSAALPNCGRKKINENDFNALSVMQNKKERSLESKSGSEKGKPRDNLIG